LGLTKRLQHLYLGVSSTEYSLIQQTSLKACTLQILTKMKADPTRCSKAKETYLEQLQALVKDLDQALKKFLDSNELSPDPCFVYLFSVLNDLENGKISDILKHLQHAVKNIAPCGIVLQNTCIRKVTAIMHEPTGSSDNPVRFTGRFNRHHSGSRYGRKCPKPWKYQIKDSLS
ncbi:integrator complex subunit 4-like, partial [Saccostrea cucullata]|uniref:integrator complex subunit 4-like n=1 Tax=Saccostrea cuccullata TaxID=36930 RepID=UPI002ECFF3EB